MDRHSRRAFLKIASMSLAAGAVNPFSDRRTLFAADAPKRPNILFVLSDDHSWPFLGCYGYPIRTPNYDRFAAEAMRFDNAFTTAPQCVPSRASLMTGISPVAAQMARFSSPLPGHLPTLPGLLQNAGYYTGACRRSYHLDGPQPLVDEPTGRLAPYVQYLIDHDMRTFQKRLDFVDVSNDRTQTPDLVNAFLDQVPAESPFFLWVNFNDPHHPWDENAVTPPNDPAKLDVPGYLPDLPSVREALGRHCDEITRSDEEFQWILDILDKRNLRDNTIVVFMGDNGLAFPHGKGCLYDPGLHVPLLVRWPGRAKPGSVCDSLVSGEDLTPTLLDVAGVQIPDSITGHSFLPKLVDKPFTPRDYIFGERGTHGSAPWATFREDVPSSAVEYSRCVRSHRFKLIYNCTPYSRFGPVDSSHLSYWKDMQRLHDAGELPERFDRVYFTFPRPIWELYDLDNDPDEMNNVFDDPAHAATIKQLKSALLENMARNRDFLPLALP